jgi:hypothetical protein
MAELPPQIGQKSSAIMIRTAFHPASNGTTSRDDPVTPSAGTQVLAAVAPITLIFRSNGLRLGYD